MDIAERRRRDREAKKRGRRLNTSYAKKQKLSKRTSKAKERRKELRQTLEYKEKAKNYVREYRKLPEVKLKTKVRDIAKRALWTGVLTRPPNCEICGKKDMKLRDGRSGLRMDHYKGYAYPLTVRFVCIECDGKQEVERANTTGLYTDG